MQSASASSLIVSFHACGRHVPLGVGRSGCDGSGPFAVSSATVGAPLASLAGGALARKFYGWRGASGARYVVTVHPGDDADWLQVEGVVVLIVEVDLDGARTLKAVAADPSAQARAAMARRAAQGAARGARIEAHLHLLAATAPAREHVVGDLARAIAR